MTRKITNHVARFSRGFIDEPLRLGNLDARRDWGHAEDYVHAMWLILMQEEPDDYVVSSGEDHSVRDFVNVAFSCIGFELLWKGKGVKEKGYIKGLKDPVVIVSEEFFRPAEVSSLKGDSSKVRDLGWFPEYSFNDLVSSMVNADIKQLRGN